MLMFHCMYKTWHLPCNKIAVSDFDLHSGTNAANVGALNCVSVQKEAAVRLNLQEKQYHQCSTIHLCCISYQIHDVFIFLSLSLSISPSLPSLSLALFLSLSVFFSLSLPFIFYPLQSTHSQLFPMFFPLFFSLFSPLLSNVIMQRYLWNSSVQGLFLIVTFSNRKTSSSVFTFTW